jgi:hypothetical protein
MESRVGDDRFIIRRTLLGGDEGRLNGRDRLRKRRRC